MIRWLLSEALIEKTFPEMSVPTRTWISSTSGLPSNPTNDWFSIVEDALPKFPARSG